MMIIMQLNILNIFSHLFLFCGLTTAVIDDKNCNSYISHEYGSSLISRQLRIKSFEREGKTSIVTFCCENNNFYLDGPVKVSCNSHGVWSSGLPVCLKYCPKISPRTISTRHGYINATNSIKTDTDNRRQNTTVHVTCVASGFRVYGSQNLTCLANASWDNPSPLCVPEPISPMSLESKLVIIFGSIGGVIVILICIHVVWILCYRRYRKQSLKSKDTDDQENIYEAMKSKSLTFHTDNSEKFEAPLSTLSFTLILCFALIVNAVYYIIFRFYKVWTYRRKRRKVFEAENLADLKLKAGSAFDKVGDVRILIENDGTEVDSDEVLNVFGKRTLMVLSDDESWTSTSDLGNTNQTTKITFDICSFNRKIRKLILADGLEDLIRQGSLCFGYEVISVCLESDGTKIEEDRSLFAYAKNFLMLLGACHIWAPGYSAFGTDKDSIYSTNRKMFKVKHRKMKARVAIVANNVVELHLNAAKVLRLHAPIQVYTEEGNVIQSDSDLDANQGKILVVSEMDGSNAAMKTINSNLHKHSFDSDSTSGYKYLPEMSERHDVILNGRMSKYRDAPTLVNGDYPKLYPTLGVANEERYQESYM